MADDKLQPIRRTTRGFGLAGGGRLSDAMRDWLADFPPEIRAAPGFERVVNGIAEGGRLGLDDNTATVVVSQVRALEGGDVIASQVRAAIDGAPRSAPVGGRPGVGGFEPEPDLDDAA